MTERWRPVVGHEGEYEVSDLGRVRSLDRTVICVGPAKGQYESRKKGRLLRPGSATAGHQTVALGRHNSRLVHHLVLEAFVGPRPPGLEARHGDGNEANNRLSNLTWDTRGNNGRDKKWHKGCSRYRLLPTEIANIKRMLARTKWTQRYIAGLYDVSESTVSCIKLGKIHIDVA